jgi:hypothetical protein
MTWRLILPGSQADYMAFKKSQGEKSGKYGNGGRSVLTGYMV